MDMEIPIISPHDFSKPTVSDSVISVSYRHLIRDPRKVCDDWFYGLMQRLPGHPALWAFILAFALPVITHLLKDIGGPIEHVRSPTEMRASYFFGPVIVVQVVVMPLLYMSALQCLDMLRRAFPVSDVRAEQLRQMMKRPTKRFQKRLLIGSTVVTLVIQEISSSRISRFITGDWNSFDIWLTFSALLSFMMFLWFLILPISRTLVLAKIIKDNIRPTLFDESLGRPIASYGLKAGLLFSVPYAIVNSASVVIVSDAWVYILPAVVGPVVAIAFALIPGYQLKRRVREVKKAELRWVENELFGRREALKRDIFSNDDLGTIVNLVNYRQQISALREWPFEARFIRGFGLYFLLIPLTWVASAIVELVIEQLGLIG